MDSFKMDEKDSLTNSFKKHPIITSLLLIFVVWIFGSALFGGSASQPADIPPSIATVQKDIVVSSQTVKQIEGKYRYFFDIRNEDETPFTGYIEMELLKSDGSNLATESFNASTPIQPGFGDSVYIDTFTGPLDTTGSANAITNFRYQAILNNQIVAQGSGEISSPEILETY